MHALVVGIVDLQPFRNLFRRPVQDQFTGDHRPQLLVDGKKAHLGSQSRLPGLTIGFTGLIEWPPPMTRPLRAYRRHSPLQPFSDLANRPTGMYGPPPCRKRKVIDRSAQMYSSI